MAISASKLTAILGGTFDPIHYGHLRIAVECLTHLPIDHVRFMPCYIPVHRKLPGTVAKARKKMVQLAIAAHPKLFFDDTELACHKPSYTIDSVTVLNRQYATLALVIGADAFAKFDTWFQWEKILQQAHLIICARTDYTPAYNRGIQAILKEYQMHDREILLNTTHGAIFMISTPLLQISATHIRSLMKKKQDARFLLPDAVLRYINENNLYCESGV